MLAETAVALREAGSVPCAGSNCALSSKIDGKFGRADEHSVIRRIGIGAGNRLGGMRYAFPPYVSSKGSGANPVAARIAL
jgi:hypothetical protein